eukprot:4536525-Prymnesium_polylepis.1
MRVQWMRSESRTQLGTASPKNSTKSSIRNFLGAGCTDEAFTSTRPAPTSTSSTPPPEPKQQLE